MKFRAGLFDHPYVDQAKATDPASFLTAGRPQRRPDGRRQVDGAAEERRRDAAARPEQEDRGDRPARRRPARHARPLVGPGRGRRRRQRVRRHQGADARRDVHARAARSATTSRRPTTRPTTARGTDDFAAAVRGGAGRRPGRAGARRDPGDERRGRRPLDARPARPAAGADRRDQGHRQAVRGGAVQRPAADAGRRGREPRRRSSRPGSRASRPATRSPTSSSARSTRAASCRCRSRSGSARCRSTTTTSRPDGPCDVTQKYDSRYRDLRSCDPLYPFGYGLSYTTFSVTDLTPRPRPRRPARPGAGAR